MSRGADRGAIHRTWRPGPVKSTCHASRTPPSGSYRRAVLPRRALPPADGARAIPLSETIAHTVGISPRRVTTRDFAARPSPGRGRRSQDQLTRMAIPPSALGAYLTGIPAPSALQQIPSWRGKLSLVATDAPGGFRRRPGPPRRKPDSPRTGRVAVDLQAALRLAGACGPALAGAEIARRAQPALAGNPGPGRR